MMKKGQGRAYSKIIILAHLQTILSAVFLEVFLAVYNSKQHRQKHVIDAWRTQREDSHLNNQNKDEESQEIEKQYQDRSNSTVPIMTPGLTLVFIMIGSLFRNI